MFACMSFMACSEKDDFNFESNALVPLVINATPASTRTVLADDGTSIHWQEGDEIAVYDYYASKHKFALEYFEGSKARFLGKITAKKDYFLTLYPYNLGADNLTESGAISVFLPTQQTATANTFASGINISVGKGARNVDGSPSVLTFYNVCQLLKFEVPEYAAGKISEIKFTASNPVAGNLTIDCSIETPVASVAADGSKEITILPPTGTTSFTSGIYYIVTAPVQIDGFTMSFVCDEKAYSLSSNSLFGGSASKIYSLGMIDLVNAPQATAKHVYSNGVLMGTKLTLTNAPLAGKEWSAVVKNASGTTVRTLSGSGDLTSTEIDSNWPYLPTGQYTVDYKFTNSNDRAITKSMRFNITEKPSYTVSTYATTSFSYYKGDGVAKNIQTANTKNSMTIYEPSITINGIDSRILNSSNYTFKSEISNINSSVKERSGAVIKYNDSNVSTLGAYSLTGKVTFDNTIISNVKTVYITGIPYEAVPPKIENGWSGNGTFQSDYVNLYNGQTISKEFWCHESIDAKITYTAEIKSSGFTKANFTLKCGNVTATIEAPIFGNNDQNNATKNFEFTPENKTVSFTTNNKTNNKIKAVKIEYSSL